MPSPQKNNNQPTPTFWWFTSLENDFNIRPPFHIPRCKALSRSLISLSNLVETTRAPAMKTSWGWLVGNLSPLFTEGFLLKSHGGFHPISEPSLVYTLKLPMLGKWIITFWNGPLLGAAMFVSFREGISFRILCWAKDETSWWLSGFLVALPTNGTHFCRKMVGPYLRNNGCQRSLNKAGYCLGRVAWGGGERHPLNFGNVLLNLLYCNEFCLKKRISYMMSWSMNSVPTC